MQTLDSPTDLNTRVKLEISVAHLRRLFDSGLLCACDLRCGDCEAKLVVQKLCLRACALKQGKLLHN